MKDKDKNEGKELQIFNNPDFGEVRTTVIDGEPWFVGKDVADALGYSNSRDAFARHVDDDDKTSVVIPDVGSSSLTRAYERHFDTPHA